MMNNNIKPADYWVKTYELKAHPEGGFYKEISLQFRTYNIHNDAN